MEHWQYFVADISLSEDCQLEDGKEIIHDPESTSYIAESSDGQTYAKSFSLSMKNYSVTIQVEGEEGGTATANPTLAEPDDTVTLTATPNPGYFFDHWEVISGNVTIENNTFTMPDSNVTIQAVFGKTSYAVTLHPNGGTIPEGSEITSYKYGEGAALPMDVTRSGYTFGGWYANEDLTDGPVTAILATRYGRQGILGEVDRERAALCAAHAGSASGNRLHPRRRSARRR